VYLASICRVKKRGRYGYRRGKVIHPMKLDRGTFRIRAVVSMGRRNTFLKFTRGRLKTQSLSWALI